MKKILTFIFVFMLFVIPVKTYADSASVEIVVNGEVKKGSTIEILVNVKDVNKFYAASVDFTYDTNQLKIESIAASDFITKHNNDIMELGGETNKNGNTASYSFTFLGEKDGIKGSGTLAVISAEVLNDKKLSIGQDNMKVKLVQRVGDTVENYSFKFSGYNNESNSELNSSSNITANNNGNTEGTTSNNTSLSGNTDGTNNYTNNNEEKNEESQANDEAYNNEQNVEKSTEENDDQLANSLEEENVIKDNNYEEDDKNNSVERDLLTSKNSDKGILTATVSILILVIAVGAGYYFYKKKK